MTVIPAGTEVPVTVTYLEMDGPPRDAPPALPADTRLERAENPPVWFFLALYDAVGRDYEWRDRFEQAENDPGALAAFVSDPKVELWTLYRDGWPQGFFQLDFRQQGICDLAYFGMVPQAVGGGLGGTLLRIAVAKGWQRAGVAKMTVNTCTLDHPRALGLYRRMGFDPVDSQERVHTLHRDRDPAGFPD